MRKYGREQTGTTMKREFREGARYSIFRESFRVDLVSRLALEIYLELSLCLELIVVRLRVRLDDAFSC